MKKLDTSAKPKLAENPFENNATYFSNFSIAAGLKKGPV
jgi:hypothetical protein